MNICREFLTLCDGTLPFHPVLVSVLPFHAAIPPSRASRLRQDEVAISDQDVLRVFNCISVLDQRLVQAVPVSSVGLFHLLVSLVSLSFKIKELSVCTIPIPTPQTKLIIDIPVDDADSGLLEST